MSESIEFPVAPVISGGNDAIQRILNIARLNKDYEYLYSYLSDPELIATYQLAYLANIVAAKIGVRFEAGWSFESIINRCEIPPNSLNKEGAFSQALWVTFLAVMKNYIDESFPLKYNSSEVFLEEYSPRFDKYDEAEVLNLFHTANWMNILFCMVPAKKNKGLAIFVVPKIIENAKARYITGSGQTNATADRVFIYEHEGNVVPYQRGKTSKKKHVANFSCGDASNGLHKVKKAVKSVECKAKPVKPVAKGVKKAVPLDSLGYSTSLIDQDEDEETNELPVGDKSLSKDELQDCLTILRCNSTGSMVSNGESRVISDVVMESGLRGFMNDSASQGNVLDSGPLLLKSKLLKKRKLENNGTNGNHLVDDTPILPSIKECSSASSILQLLLERQSSDLTVDSFVDFSDNGMPSGASIFSFSPIESNGAGVSPVPVKLGGENGHKGQSRSLLQGAVSDMSLLGITRQVSLTSVHSSLFDEAETKSVDIPSLGRQVSWGGIPGLSHSSQNINLPGIGFLVEPMIDIDDNDDAIIISGASKSAFPSIQNGHVDGMRRQDSLKEISGEVELEAIDINRRPSSGLTFDEIRRSPNSSVMEEIIEDEI